MAITKNGKVVQKTKSFQEQAREAMSAEQVAKALEAEIIKKFKADKFGIDADIPKAKDLKIKGANQGAINQAWSTYTLELTVKKEG